MCYRIVSFVALLFAGTAQAALCEFCPPCISTWLGTDCTARNFCQSTCESLSALRSQAAERLERDFASRKSEVTVRLAAERSTMTTNASSTVSTLQQALSSRYATTQMKIDNTAAALQERETAVPTQFNTPLSDAASCLGSALPPSVGAAYGALASWSTRRRNVANAVATQARAQVGVALTSAKNAALASVDGVTQPLRQLVVNGRLDAAAQTLRDQIQSNPSDLEGLANTLRNFVNNGFPTLTTARDQELAAIAGIVTTANAALASLRIGAQIAARDSANATANRAYATLAGLPPVDPVVAVPSWGSLRASLYGASNWPTVLKCLCRAVSPAPVERMGRPSELKNIADTICATQIVLASIPNGYQLYSATEADAALPAPIDLNYSPSQALSPAGLAALRAKSGVYEAQMVEGKQTVDGVVMNCIKVRPNGSRLGSCGNTSTSNAGGMTGKLLAARAWKFETLMRLGDAAAIAALKDLYVSLVAELNIMTIASVGVVSRRTDGSVVPVEAGMPVRGYVLSGTGFDDDEMLTFPPDVENASFHFFDVRGLTKSADGTFARAATQGLHAAFKERESVDDTPAALMGLAAAHEALLRWMPTDARARGYRRKIAVAMETFGGWFVDKQLKIPQLSNGQAGWAGDNSDLDDPLALLQDLSWLRTIIAVSTQERGNTGNVTALVTKYAELVTHMRTSPKFAAMLMGYDFASIVGWRLWLFKYPSHAADLWMVSVYLLSKYETDAALRPWYQAAAGVAWHIARPFRFPDQSFLALASIDGLTRPTRDGMVAQAAAILRQYRDVPEPFGNPAPTSSDAADPGLYYRDFHGTPLVDLFASAYRESVAQPGTRAALNSLSDKLGDNAQLGNDQGSLWPLGPGLAPKPHSSTPNALVGGEWSDGLMGPEVVEVDLVNGLKLRMPSSHDYLVAYWFARFMGYLPQ